MGVLGVHDGMIIEYDASTLAPRRKVAVIDAAINAPCEGAECVAQEQALIMYSEDASDVTVVQPNEDGSYWRKIVRNKMHRMKEQRREKAAKKFMAETFGTEDAAVYSSFGPYTSTIGQVYKKNDLALPAISTKPFSSKI